ncbi:MAG TPA: hypothetical protein VHN11_08600 [Xanthobacteraceae bacterium]|nr:hypothetical protein [Xanthobacteraceae bacterium]
MALKQLQAATDNLEKIVEVVYHAPRRLTDRFYLLSLAELRLHLAAIGNIDAATEIAGKVPFL